MWMLNLSKEIVGIKNRSIFNMSDMSNNNRKEKYEFFLENLLTKLKNNILSHEEQEELTEFYINYMFRRENIEDDRKKLEKYMSLGWYIYEILNKDNNKINNEWNE